MKKLLVLTVLALLSSACSVLQPMPTTLPAVDTQATIDSMVLTASVLTMTAQPSATVAPPTETGMPTIVFSPTSVPFTETPSATPIPNLTTTPATATLGTDPISTTTLASSSGVTTLTPTVGPLTYGTLPPAVPWGKVSLVNKSEAQAYISLQLQNTVAEGAILEYPVHGTVKIDAPVGNYVYVLWVGGRQLIGTLKVHKDDDLTVIIYKDRVEIR